MLTHPAFRLYFFGSIFSNLGTWLQNTAQALLAFRLTHSVLAVGVIVCAQFSAVLFLGPWAGTVVARVRSLPRLLVITQLASAAAATALAVLYFDGLLTEVWLGAGAFTLGVAYCFALPAFTVLVPALVSGGETRAAMAMNSVSYNIGRATAPPFAVLVITTIGSGWAFLLNGVSFLVLAVVLYRLRSRLVQTPSSLSKIMDGFRLVRQARGVQPLLAMVTAVTIVVAAVTAEVLSRLRSGPILRSSSRGKIMKGFRVARKEPSILLLLAMVAAVTIAADPVLVLGPAMAQHFGVSGNWAGYFLAALGAGTVAGSLIPVRSPSRLRHAAYPLFFLGGAVIVFALGLQLWLCLAMAFAAGIACLLTGAVAQTLLLALAGPGRAAIVMAVWAVAWAGSKPVASLVDGLLATFVGIRVAGLLMALPALLPGLLVMVLPEQMRLRSKPETPVAVTIN